MKTILHTIDTNEPGGAETVFIDLATNLPKEQYRSIVVISGKGWLYDELRNRGIEPVLANTRGSFNWRFFKDLVTLIRRENVDLIQSHLFGSNVYCSLAGLLLRVPVVATFHGAVDIEMDERFLKLKTGAVNLGANRIIAVSKYLRDNIVNRTKLKGNKIRVIYNGIKTSAFQRPHSSCLRKRFGWADNDVIVGCLGNIHQAKGYDVLLHAAATLKQRSFTYRIVIAGHEKKSLYADLLNLRARLELEDSVQFIGFYDDPADFLANIDLFLLPSISEGFSIATIQAMAAELPVIATRSGGPEEIITHDVDGWMIEPGKSEAIVEAVEKLARDRALKKRLAVSGRKHAIESFNLDAMLKAYEKLYCELLA